MYNYIIIFVFLVQIIKFLRNTYKLNITIRKSLIYLNIINIIATALANNYDTGIEMGMNVQYVTLDIGYGIRSDTHGNGKYN